MGWLVDKTKEHPIEVENPEGEKAEVRLRKMDEGDYQDRQDLVAKIRLKTNYQSKNGRRRRRGEGNAEDQDMSYMIGEIRKFDLRRSIVSWDLPFDLSDHVIRTLDPFVAEQIHEGISDLNPFIFQQDMPDGAEEGNPDNAGDEAPKAGEKGTKKS